MQEQIESLKESIQQGNVVAFTGAGVSEESGIPTYRGTGGFWMKYDPNKYASVDYFYQDPSYYWTFFKEIRGPLLHESKPNPAHIALAEMEKAGFLDNVITQNIDGLHQAAGAEKVIELHGSSRRFYCMECKTQYNLEETEAALEIELPPKCASCRGILRPDVVFFGETLPPGALEDAFSWAGKSKLLLVIGSSCVVYPAAQVPAVANQAGSKLAIINLEPTPMDHLADWVFHKKAGEILPLLV